MCMTHVQRTMVVLSDKASWPFHDAFSASFVQACNDALNRAVTIFLLVRQQLERTDQGSQSPKGAACDLTPFASVALTPSCRTSILLGASQSYWPPHAAHHQLECFFILLLPSPCPVDTQQMWSSNGKQLQCGQTYDKVTPPIPSTGRQKSVFFSGTSCAMPKRPISSIATLSQASRVFSKVHSQSFPSFLPVFFFKNSPNYHASLRCRHGASFGDHSLCPDLF